MNRALLPTLLLLLPAAALTADESSAERQLWPCVESVVIARVAKIGALLDYNTEDALVLHAPSHVDLRIKRVLSGISPPRRLTTIFQPERVRGDALFLLGRRKGSWVVLGLEPYVARDREGRYVVPFFREALDEDLAPQGWIPPDYRDRLREIRYDPLAVAWMGERHDAEPGWAHIEGEYSVANRGLILDDPAALMAQRLAEPCERNAP